jgi:hypothetical protein
VNATSTIGRRDGRFEPWATTPVISLAVAIVLLTVTLPASDQPTNAVMWGGMAVPAYSAGLMSLVERRQQTGRDLARSTSLLLARRYMPSQGFDLQRPCRDSDIPR